MGSLIKQLAQFVHPHYLVNIFLAVVYFVVKTWDPFCYMLFEDCRLELKEWEWLTFLGCLVVLKNRKQPSYKVYLATVCMFGKMLNLLLFFRNNPLAAAIYTLACLLHLVFLPEPAYSGPDLVTFFRGPNLEEELERDKRVTWLVEFYAAWSPNCVNFSSSFAELSGKYSLENLKFGKLDATRFPDVAEKYQVNISSWSKQLPTLILFQGGKETRRRPVIDTKGKVLAKFVFSADNVVRDFELTEIYHQCKQNPITKKKKADKQITDAAEKKDK